MFVNNRVGIEIPKIEVRYRNLSVEGDMHVGSRALPTLFNVTLNTFEVFNFICSFEAQMLEETSILNHKNIIYIIIIVI